MTLWFTREGKPIFEEKLLVTTSIKKKSVSGFPMENTRASRAWFRGDGRHDPTTLSRTIVGAAKTPCHPKKIDDRVER